MRKVLSAITAASLLLLLGAGSVPASAAEGEGIYTISLSSAQQADGSWSHTALYEGEAVPEYDYVWHADPSQVHDEVKDSPAEYYTGETSDGSDPVYIAHDIYYYPELDEDGFQRENYDGEMEWVYRYTAEGYEDYIFATLPVTGSALPTQMMHSAEEAYENAVLHITQPGTYVLEGEWHGQIWIDLGDTDDTFADESAKVTLILNGVDVTCTVAPALVFYSVYECDNTWEEQTTWSEDVDTSDAGARVVIADGTENNFSGTNIYRILKTKYKDDTETAQKKRLKIDGAFYSYMSMEIEGGEAGDGVLNISAGFEGLDTELHLTLNGGNVHIVSQDDGINVNEDGVSVVTINGGSLHIVGGAGSEGDGIDSNGFLVINGGVVISTANPAADAAVQTGFDDVAPDSWYYEAVSFMAGQGLMTGTSGTAFSPDETTTRGMVATILYRLAGAPEGEELAFADVAAGQWYTAGVSWAAANGVMEGDGSRFAPEEVVTREQMVALAYRYAQLQGYDAAADSGSLSAYADGDSVSDWAAEAMAWAVDAGVLNGKDGGRLDPQGQLTRAEAAQILTNLIQVLQTA